MRQGLEGATAPCSPFDSYNDIDYAPRGHVSHRPRAHRSHTSRANCWGSHAGACTTSGCPARPLHQSLNPTHASLPHWCWCMPGARAQRAQPERHQQRGGLHGGLAGRQAAGGRRGCRGSYQPGSTLPLRLCPSSSLGGRTAAAPQPPHLLPPSGPLLWARLLPRGSWDPPREAAPPRKVGPCMRAHVCGQRCLGLGTGPAWGWGAGGVGNGPRGLGHGDVHVRRWCRS